MRDGSSVTSRAFDVLMLLSFSSLACCSIVIPDSIDLAAALGQEFAESSIPVSIFRLGSCCGGLAIFFIERHWQLNQPHSVPLNLGRFKMLLLTVLICEMCGAAGYTIVASMAAINGPTSNYPVLWVVLLIARWVMGLGDGLNFSSIYLFIMGAYPAADRARKLAYWQTVNIMAIGIGPILSSGSSALPSYAQFTNVGWTQLALLTIAFAAFLLRYPSLDHVLSVEASDAAGRPKDGAVDPQSEDVSSRQLIVVGGLFITGLRNFAVGGLEVGSASLLEVQLALSASDVGLMIGLAFLACILVRALYLTLQHSLSNYSWVRVHAALAIAAATLIFKGWGGRAWELPCAPSGTDCARTARAAFLLVGDSLGFGAHLYGSALTSNAYTPQMRPSDDCHTVVSARTATFCIHADLRRLLPPCSQSASWLAICCLGRGLMPTMSRYGTWRRRRLAGSRLRSSRV